MRGALEAAFFALLGGDAPAEKSGAMPVWLPKCAHAWPGLAWGFGEHPHLHTAHCTCTSTLRPPAHRQKGGICSEMFVNPASRAPPDPPCKCKTEIKILMKKLLYDVL